MSTQKMQKSFENKLFIRTILKPDVVVLSGIKEVDCLLGGFKAGEISFIDGDSDIISKMPDQICVNTYRTFKSDVIYLDSGICTNPYRIAQYARKMEVDQKETLGHVRISRAFTVHQLTSILQETLEPIIKKHKPQTLIIGRFPILYLDSDVSSSESQTLLKKNIEKIRELTKKYNLITIFTNIDKKMVANNRNVRSILYDFVDEILLFKDMELSTRVQLVKKQKGATILKLEEGQMQLQEFGMVI